MVMANKMLDEVIVGAPGSGLFGMLLFALVAVFVAGLMVGRTPEYLGKKIQSADVKMAVLALLVVPATILVLTSVAAVLPAGLAGLSNAGPHGFSELLYAYTSAAATNGSAFAGLSANTISSSDIGLGDAVRKVPRHRPSSRNCRVTRRESEGPCLARYLAD